MYCHEFQYENGESVLMTLRPYGIQESNKWMVALAVKLMDRSCRVWSIGTFHGILDEEYAIPDDVPNSVHVLTGSCIHPVSGQEGFAVFTRKNMNRAEFTAIDWVNLVFSCLQNFCEKHEFTELDAPDGIGDWSEWQCQFGIARTPVVLEGDAEELSVHIACQQEHHFEPEAE